MLILTSEYSAGRVETDCVSVDFIVFINWLFAALSAVTGEDYLWNMFSVSVCLRVVAGASCLATYDTYVV